MIENKELPSEYVSIRQVWLQGINDSRKAISQQAILEATYERSEDVTGAKTVCHTINALHLSLVDYGEALVRTEVDKWYNEYYVPRREKIWNQKRRKTQGVEFAGLADEDDEIDEKSYQQKWWDTARLNQKLYDQIIKVLNKYNMLFPEQPKGYSNVEMKSK
jgi:hypothetical protein